MEAEEVKRKLPMPDAEGEDEESTARVLNHPFFSGSAKAQRRATWKRLRGGAHGSG